MEAYSNHVPIWVNTEGEGKFSRYRKQFKFEEMWVGKQSCEDIIKSTWRRGDGGISMLDIMIKIKECGSQLHNWNKHSFGNVKKQLHLARQHIEMLNASNLVGKLSTDHDRAREEV